MAVSRATETKWALTEVQIFLALAAQVPLDGVWTNNPYKKWSDIDPALPATDILAYPLRMSCWYN